MKLGAFDYLAKPADADEIDAALRAKPGARAEPPENPMSADRVRWEHIQRVYELCGRNVSETARRLNMHRRNAPAHPRQARPALRRATTGPLIPSPGARPPAGGGRGPFAATRSSRTWV